MEENSITENNTKPSLQIDQMVLYNMGYFKQYCIKK